MAKSVPWRARREPQRRAGTKPGYTSGRDPIDAERPGR
jgi:hypothetical protein